MYIIIHIINVCRISLSLSLSAEGKIRLCFPLYTWSFLCHERLVGVQSQSLSETPHMHNEVVGLKVQSERDEERTRVVL
jgi:hypothetical protein